MRLYHTGYAPIPAPDLRRGRRNADFGQGFYCADTDAFAGKWARERRGERVYVNAYELDETGLAILRLERDEEWYRIVFSNRAGRGDLTAGADAVVGPIANDTVYDTLGVFTSGFLAPEEALRLLRVGPCYTQIALKTERAAAQLRFLGARELEAGEIARFADALRREQEEYLAALTRAMSD